uniref:STEAP3 metalloreductase n=1 Tax=Myripristis murdjan TaxID=586833 RepID=A0A667ZWU5_9TELE
MCKETLMFTSWTYTYTYIQFIQSQNSACVSEKRHTVYSLGKCATLVTFLLFLFFYGYNVVKHVLLPYLAHGEHNFYQLPLETVNQTLPAVALILLGLVYLPGLVAAVLQLARGTKYKRFPSWLDRWMCRRKELGLMSFLCAGVHAVYSMCLTLRRAAGYRLLNAAYRQVKAGVENSWEEQQVWRSDLYLSCGILGLGVLTLLALTSLPSVGNALNWREFTFMQVSRLQYQNYSHMEPHETACSVISV